LFAVIEIESTEAAMLGVRAGFSPPEIHFNECGSGIGARGHVERIVWVSISADGSPTIFTGPPGEVPRPVSSTAKK
jgi:hypothetical protein